MGDVKAQIKFLFSCFLIRQASDIEDELIKEICQHSGMCKEKSRIFHGRDDVIASIISYIGRDNDSDGNEEDTGNAPLVVHGESGCGKTSVIAKAAALAKTKYPDRLQVVRFLGTTAESSTISRVLRSICNQIQRTAELPLDASKPQV